MTLINYLTRVHFADGVLEEAVRSEMEFSTNRRPLILIKKGGMTEVLAERLFTSMPTRSSAEVYELPPAVPDDTTAIAVAKHYQETECDMIIACGGRSAIGAAKLARLMLVQSTPPSAYLGISSRLKKLSDDLPNLLVVPDICGLCSAATPQCAFLMPDGTRAVMHVKELTPTAAVFDPTLTIGANAVKTASSGVEAVARCMEAFLSRAYNPPADGMALDGLIRAFANLHKVLGDDTITARREMMASALNAALAQQKGIGTTHTLGLALGTATGREIDLGSVARVLLPSLLAFHAEAAKGKYQPLRQVLGISPRSSLSVAVETFFSDLPLPARLSEMGVSQKDSSRAAGIASSQVQHTSNPRAMDAEDLAQMMQTAW